MRLAGPSSCALLTLTAAYFFSACSTSDDGSTGASGRTNTGGVTTGTGGTANTGGKTSSGGTTAAGGASTAGGTSTTGGTSASGGATAAGGTSTGGASTAAGGTSGGGTSTSGGAATSGAGGTGGGSVIDPDSIPKPESKLIGWAATSACNINAGSNNFIHGEPIEISGAQLQDAVRDDTPRTLLFSGVSERIELTGSNKTIIGTEGAVIRGGISISGGKKNSIVRNMKFSGGDDAVQVRGASCIWFDHIDAFDAQDGNMDITQGSDLITVSWSRFYYVEKNHDHRLSNLNGADSGDTPGKINITFHHNWWGDKVLQRMPRVRHGKVHVFNNYYSTKEAQYFFGLSDHAKLVVQNNFAEYPPSEHPIKFFNTSGTQISMEGNVLAGFGNGEDRATGGMPWNPKDVYDYTLDSPEYAKAAVMKWAGPDDKKFGR